MLSQRQHMTGLVTLLSTLYIPEIDIIYLKHAPPRPLPAHHLLKHSEYIDQTVCFLFQRANGLQSVGSQLMETLYTMYIYIT